MVERALRQAYNEEGFLKAEVVGRPLTIDGTIGVLPVDIKEGPRAQITKPDVGRRRPRRGCRRSRRPRRLTPPAPYVAADVNEARVRIEEHYRRQGFNDAEVEVEPAIAPDDTVALTFKVAEGPQQVLQGGGADGQRGHEAARS